MDRMTVARATLAKPNSEMTWDDFDRTQDLHQRIFGEHFAILELGKSAAWVLGDDEHAVLSVWPILPTVVLFVPSPKYPDFKILYGGQVFSVDAAVVDWHSNEGVRR